MTAEAILDEVASAAEGVALAVLPLAVLFLVFQVFFLKLPPKEVSRILTGTAIASVGLFLFLLGVIIGFLPFGRAIGEVVASLPMTGLCLFGILLGFVTAFGEPAVRILADQVEEASSGSIRNMLVVYAVCIGVAAAVAVGLVRVVHGIPLSWILVPGYALVVALIWLSDKAFVSIAVDAGGVATGPLANTFLLAVALGAASATQGRDALVDGLGLVALISLATVIAIMALGVLVRVKGNGKES